MSGSGCGVVFGRCSPAVWGVEFNGIVGSSRAPSVQASSSGGATAGHAGEEQNEDLNVEGLKPNGAKILVEAATGMELTIAGLPPR